MSTIITSFKLHEQQRAAVEVRGQDIVVTAGAGSGKTRTLVARYLCLLDEGLKPPEIAAITFTDKAAREMRNRIRQEIHEWRSGDCPPEEQANWELIEADIDAARIGTIHGLCSALLRSHPAEAVIDPCFGVLDENVAAVLQKQSIEDSLNWAIDQTEMKPLLAAFKLYELERMLARLFQSRLEVASVVSGSDLFGVWDQAVRRAVIDFVRADEIQAAIAELRTLRDTGRAQDDAGPLLAEQMAGLLNQWNTLENAIERKAGFDAAKALFGVRRPYCDGRSGKKDSLARAVIKTIKERYDKDVAPWLNNGRSSEAEPSSEFELQTAELATTIGQLFIHAQQTYQAAKDLRQALDFDDLEAGAAALLERPEIRKRWQRQIKAVLVDEFQDTNERQRRIIEALAGIPEGISGRLFVVGDAKQSIYRFRGADVEVFRRLDQDVSQRGGKHLAIDLTYRAHAPLIGSLNELLATTMGTVDAPTTPFVVPFSALHSARAKPKDGVGPPYLELLFGIGENADDARPTAATLLARRLKSLHDDEHFAWEELALLFRASSGFPVYETALEQAGIPYVTVAGQGFYERPEVRDLLNCLRALADPWDDLAMAGLLRSPGFGLSDAALYQLRWPENARNPLSFIFALREDLGQLSATDRDQAIRAREIIEQLLGLLDRVPVAVLLKDLIDRTAYRAVLASASPGARLQRNVDKLLSDAHHSGLVRVSEFLEYVDTLREGGAREGEAPVEVGGAVRLMSIHKAKGLEFPVVAIADASRGRPTNGDPVLVSRELGLVACPRRSTEIRSIVYLLAKQIDNQCADAEDRRVLYVAATRAKEKLLVCGHQTQHTNWLAQLASAAGLDPKTIGDYQGKRWAVKLPLSGEVVAFDVCGPQDENQADVAVENSPIEDEPPPKGHLTPEPGAQKFYAPIPSEHEQPSEDWEGEEAQPKSQWVRKARIRHSRTDGTVLGLMVHEALRRWCFPGDPRLPRLLEIAARSGELVNTQEIAAHIEQASTLLSRLKADPHWSTLNQAKRAHEMPFVVMKEAKPVLGIIDLLYPDIDGNWHVVDFKTDHIVDGEAFTRLLDKEDYRAQITRYRYAVTQLLGGAVIGELCFLDFADTVRWEPVGNVEGYVGRGN